MKVLLDENIDVRLKKHLLQFHEVYTVNDMQWKGIKDGELLKLILHYNFDCWIVVDKNTLKNLIPFIPQILLLLESSTLNTLIILEEQ